MAIKLLAHNASPWTGPAGNTTWLLPGAEPALIDAGVGRAEHLDAIADALGGAPLRRILLTHSHPDHAGGVPALRRRWPSAVVRAGDTLTDGEIVPAGNGSLRALHTPGHAPDHYCFLDAAAGDVYSGDLVREGGTIVIPASRGGNLRDYLASLRHVLALRPARLLPGHGSVIEHPSVLLQEYLDHRADRERQVIAARARGASTPAEIVAQLYPDLPSSLRAAAEDTVQAHLVKLREDALAR